MKKHIQILVVIALVLTLIGIAKNNPAWANELTSPAQSDQSAGVGMVGFNAAQPMSIVVTGSGSYLIGGVCQFNVNYKAVDLKNEVDSEVPIKESIKVPFNKEGELYYPGCHIVHYKLEQVVNEAKAEDGEWQVCFGKRPDVELKVYYYLDNPPSGMPVWNELPTTSEGAYTCALALYTGVYMPAGIVLDEPGNTGVDLTPATPTPSPGSVQPPPFNHIMTKSGIYGVGGICTLEALYKVDGLKDELWEEFYVEDTLFVAFPDNGDLLFFPGCHVLHFEFAIAQELMGSEKGTWQICFAAHPDKQMTIYVYEALEYHLEPDPDDYITPPWKPLPSTTENGLVCAPAVYSGVYVPAGK